MILRVLLLALSLLAAITPSLQAELSLQVDCTIPAPATRLSGVTVDARLWEYDPRLADAPAKQVDRVQRHGLSLGVAGATKVTLQLSANRTEDRNYYVTVFVHPGPTSTLRLYFIDGFTRVFSGQDSETATITLTRTTAAAPLSHRDTDGDGATDAEEAAAGTNPGSAASRFEVVSMQRKDDAVVLEWTSRPGRLYSVLVGDSPDAMGAFADGIAAEAGLRTKFELPLEEANRAFIAVSVD